MKKAWEQKALHILWNPINIWQEHRWACAKARQLDSGGGEGGYKVLLK